MAFTPTRGTLPLWPCLVAGRYWVVRSGWGTDTGLGPSSANPTRAGSRRLLADDQVASSGALVREPEGGSRCDEADQDRWAGCPHLAFRVPFASRPGLWEFAGPPR